VSSDLLSADQSGFKEPPTAEARALGVVRVSDGAAAKLAARAAIEQPDVGGATPRLLGRTVPGAGHLGIRQTSLSALPATSAQVDGQSIFVDISVSVRWPASVPQVTAALRHHLRERLHTLTGLRVAEVRITVTDLVTEPAPTRVQ
jgi:hypothetical protein